MKKLILLITFIFSIAFQTYSANMPDYVEKELWNDSWPIYDAKFYNGSEYIVQMYCHSKGWEIRLIEMKINTDATLSDSGHHWVLDSGKETHLKNDGGIYCNAALEEFNGKLYILSDGYQTGHKLHVLENDGIGASTLTSLKCPINNYDDGFGINKRNFCMTKYRNALMIFSSSYELQESGQLIVCYTKDDPSHPNASWKTYLSDKKFIDTTYKPFGFNDFTVTNWVGTRENKDGQMEMTEELIFGQFYSGRGRIQVVHFDGDPDYLNKERIPLSDKKNYWPSERQIESDRVAANLDDAGKGFGLTAVCGNIINVGTADDNTNINVPVQFIMAFRKKYVTGNIHQRQICFYEYNPETMSFSKSSKDNVSSFATNLPYGKFGACVVSIPISGTTKETYDEKNDKFYEDKDGDIDVTTYQRYISVFSGSCYDNHFNKHHYYAMIKSNQLKVKKAEVPTTELVKDRNTRIMCTLVGVIEGAPPTVVDNEEMFEAVVNSLGDGVSYVELGQKEENSISSENSMKWGHTNIAGFDGYAGGMQNLASFSVMGGGGYEMNKTTKEGTSIRRTFTKSISNSCEDDTKTGWYLYIVPTLDQYLGMLYSPDGVRSLDGSGGITTYVQTGSQTRPIKYYLDSPKIDSRIRIENPLKLESWKDRSEKLFKNAGTPLFDSQVEADTGITESIETTTSSSYSVTKESSWEFMAKTKFFQHKSAGSVKWTSKTESAVGGDLKYGIKKIRSSRWKLEDREKPIANYDFEAYLFKDADNPAAKIYYDDLIERGMMYKEDRPFILAWNIRRFEYDYDPDFFSISADVNELEDISDFHVLGSLNGIDVTSGGNQLIEVYNTSGLKVYSGICQSGTTSIPLPTGLYVVKGSSKSVKTAVR